MHSPHYSLGFDGPVGSLPLPRWKQDLLNLTAIAAYLAVLGTLGLIGWNAGLAMKGLGQ